MKYLFILGRNPKLSICEILSYFSLRNRIINYNHQKNALLIELKEKIEKDVIDKLGGSLAVGEVIAEGNIREIEKQLKSKIIYFGTENKLNYILWNFSPNFEAISYYLKRRFKEERLKACQKPMRGLVSMQEGEHIEIVPSLNLIQEQYFIYSDRGKEYFGRITQRYNAKEIEKRDMSRPIRREELAISPRLAKILVNLSKVKENETLLDPFCGVGMILQEALLNNLKVIGIDINKDAVNGARRNLEFMNFPSRNYKLICGDSKNIQLNEKVSGIATEPDLGKVLKKMPVKNEAEKTLADFEQLIILVINNFKENIHGRVVLTTPIINTPGGRLQCNVKNILDKTNLKIAKIGEFRELIQEYREGQIVGRGILVLER